MTFISRKEQYIRNGIKGILVILLLGVFGFVGFQVYPLIHGPSLEFTTLTQGMHVDEPLIRIAGIARHTQELIVNGVALPLSPTGDFDEKLLMNPGYNIITVLALDRFGKHTTQTYTVFLAEEASTLPLKETIAVGSPVSTPAHTSATSL